MEIDARPHIQLRLTRKEFNAWVRATNRWQDMDADEMVRKAAAIVAPDLAAQVGRDPVIYDIVLVEPSWLLTTGEVARWTRDPIPKE